MGIEFSFKYDSVFIDYAYHFEKDKRIYEINIYNEATRHTKNFYFLDINEMLSQKIINGNTIEELWEYLEN